MYTTVLLGREALWAKNLRYGIQSRRKTAPLIHNFVLGSLLLGIHSTSARSWDSTFLTVRNIRVCLCAFSCSSAECLSLLHGILCEECLPILSWTATQATLSRALSARMSFDVGDDAQSAQIVTTSTHAQVTNLQPDRIYNFRRCYLLLYRFPQLCDFLGHVREQKSASLTKTWASSREIRWTANLSLLSIDYSSHRTEKIICSSFSGIFYKKVILQLVCVTAQLIFSFVGWMAYENTVVASHAGLFRTYLPAVALSGPDVMDSLLSSGKICVNLP